MTTGEKGKTKNIIFFGDDENFYDSLKPRFVDKYTQYEWEFLSIPENKEQHVQTKFLDMVRIKPNIIYFDFSSYGDEIKVLIDMIVKEPRFRETAKIGLCEKKEDCVKYTGLGLQMIYVKGAELHDFVFGPLTQAMPGVAQKEQFATARCEVSTMMQSFGKIGFMTASYMHIESNMQMEQGNTVFVNNNLERSLLPSSNFTVKVAYDYDVHYQFNYAYDLEYHFVDQPNLDDDSDMMYQEDGEELDAVAQAKKLEDLRERRQDEIDSFDHRLKQTKKKVKEWVWDRLDAGKEKKLKVMVYDPQMRVLKEEKCKPLDSYSFSLRCFSKLSEDLDEINKIRPGIIAVQLIGDIDFTNRDVFLKAIESYKNKNSGDGPPKAGWQMADEEKELQRLKKNLPEIEAEDNELIKNIVEKVKSIDKYTPIIVLLNCHLQTASALQQTYQYPMIMTNEAPISTLLIESMASMFMTKTQEKYEALMTKKLNQLKQKDPKKYQRFSISDLKEKRFYINKNDEMGIVRYGQPGIITKINESEVVITSDSILSLGMYYVEEPFPMFVTLIPVDKGKPFLKEKGTNFYRGLINGISEEDKQELRRHVNEVLFAPLQEQREKELESFQSLNELKLQEKIEEEKKLEEDRLAELNTDGEEGEEAATEEGAVPEASPEDETKAEVMDDMSDLLGSGNDDDIDKAS